MMKSTRPGRLDIRYLLPLLDDIGRFGLDRPTLERASGVTLERRSAAESLLDTGELESLLDFATTLSHRSDLAFELGLMIKPNHHGMLGYAMMCSPNLDQAIQLLCRHMPLVTDLVALRYQRSGRGSGAVLSVTPAVPMSPAMMRAVVEVAAAALHQHIVLLGAPRTAYELVLNMPVPAHHGRYVELAPAYVQFGHEGPPGFTAHLGADLLDAALPLSAPRVLAAIEDRLHVHLRRIPAGTRWADYLNAMLRESPGRLPTLDELAQRLGVTTRTVDRHLAAEGTSYRDLTRAVRIERARELLGQPGVTVSQVAARLGFGDAASFSRAFRRGAGMAPGEYQRGLRAGPAAAPEGDEPEAL